MISPPVFASCTGAPQAGQLLKPSASLADLQARQRLAWAAVRNARVSSSCLAASISTELHGRIGAQTPLILPHSQVVAQEQSRSNVTHGARRGGARGVAAWHVARCARSLHALPLCQGKTGEDFRRLADVLTCRMSGWHSKYSGRADWAHFFNKVSFMHEMEEVLLPLRVLRSLRPLKHSAVEPVPVPIPGKAATAPKAFSSVDNVEVTVVDLCGGKGFLTMCIAHGVLLSSALRVERVVLLEKARVNWAHLQRIPGWSGAPSVEIWGPPKEKFNLFDEAALKRLAELPGKLMLIGIHLCRRLATRAIEIFNLLGPDKAIGLILAPCCLPIASGMIDIWRPAAGAEAAGHQLWNNSLSRAWSAPDAVRSLFTTLRHCDISF